MKQRVVITGMGIYSCIGQNLEQVKNSLFHGRSGIGIDKKRIELGFLSPLTGILEIPDLKAYNLDRKSRNYLPEQGKYAYVATCEAFRNAGIDQDFLDHNEVGILYGNDSSTVPIMEAIDTVREEKNTVMVGAASVFQCLNSTITMNLSTIFKLKGVNYTVSGACASSSYAINIAAMLIRNGLANCILCGGAQEINPYVVGAFDGLSAFSTKNINEPAKASRPFDAGRDGLVPSGGAASLVLESYESAVKRGAPIIAEIIGTGFSSNGDHISNPNIDGPKRSLEKALKDAGVSLDEIKYINAHATSTPVGDRNEAKAIHEVFGNHKPYVASTKSMTGHEFWMAGASEVIYSTLMMNNNFIAPNINFETPDEASAFLNIPTKRIDTEFDIFLSNSFGFGGTNSTLIVKKTKVRKGNF
jgi:3-oxoacyl-[acyl-carrier-protein] synthase-1